MCNAKIVKSGMVQIYFKDTNYIQDIAGSVEPASGSGAGTILIGQLGTVDYSCNCPDPKMSNHYKFTFDDGQYTFLSTEWFEKIDKDTE